MYTRSIATILALAAAGSALPLLNKRAQNVVVSGSMAVGSVNDQDSSVQAADTYKFYSGDGSTAAGWPAISQWASFDSLWAANAAVMPNVCNWNGWGVDNSQSEIDNVRAAIEASAAASGVDHRFILAVMMQESKGCVRVPTTNGGVRNPGLMQDHDGTHSCNDAGNVQNPCPAAEINGMIQDGVGGTDAGDGLAATINQAEGSGKSGAQGFYTAARIYNSGSVDPSGDLGAGGATHCYSSDIANRLTGWVLAATQCTI
ncbi:MAG: hypothetical protein Q9227_007974 [Pyrenula ochraceoflavens]